MPRSPRHRLRCHVLVVCSLKRKRASLLCKLCYLTCVVDSILLLLHFTYGCSELENPEASDFEKIASASGSFSTLWLPSSLPLPTSFIKVLPLPQNFNRFQLPLPHPWLPGIVPQIILEDSLFAWDSSSNYPRLPGMYHRFILSNIL